MGDVAAYKAVFQEVAASENLEFVFAEDRISSRHILEKIEAMILEADAGIYDVSGWNPNVALEYGLSRGLRHPALIAFNPAHISPEEVPSDVRGFDRLQYNDLDELRVGLQKFASDLNTFIAEHRSHLDADSLPRAQTEVAGTSPNELRAEVIRLLQGETDVGLRELLAAERREFERLVRQAIGDASEKMPGPKVDHDVLAGLDSMLSPLFERRLATMLPILEYSHLRFSDEVEWLGSLAGQDWREIKSRYAAWTSSPRWISWFLTSAAGLVAAEQRSLSALRRIWEQKILGDDRPLPATKLLASHDLAMEIATARIGKRPRLGEVWHLCVVLSKASLMRDHYPGAAETIETALQSFGDYTYLLGVLAGRDGVEVIRWWTETGTTVPELLKLDNQFQQRVVVELMGLPDSSDNQETIYRALHDVRGPRPSML